MSILRNKVSYWKLYVYKDGTYYFTKSDPENPSLPALTQQAMTQEQVRQFYRINCGLSEKEIDQRLRTAHEAAVIGRARQL